ncbi:hypothetical protein LZP73_17645 [Shewanella sp. AS16]|uniref:hypothetical protein n=1 Tax=Shewanella sp. AS16 TaxID=2907625 RepID=UPI001F3B37EB|nr:hypothetical protein [Shewanella sp. AS16]MCE9688002.1 hypothetical protein [Shewanella sp. AS16]
MQQTLQLQEAELRHCARIELNNDSPFPLFRRPGGSHYEAQFPAVLPANSSTSILLEAQVGARVFMGWARYQARDNPGIRLVLTLTKSLLPQQSMLKIQHSARLRHEMQVSYCSARRFEARLSLSEDSLRPDAGKPKSVSLVPGCNAV